MSNVTLGGPYPKCPKCDKGDLVPIVIDESGYITWRCTNPNCDNSF